MTVKYVSRLDSKEIKTISLEDLDNWDFKNKFIEVIQASDEFVHPYFDLDFELGLEQSVSEFAEEFEKIMDQMYNLEDYFEKIFYAGYCTNSELYSKLNSHHDYIKLREEGHTLSVHVYFPDVKIARESLSHNKKAIAEVLKCDPKVYSSGMQKFRHPYSDKHKAGDRSIMTEIAASKLVIACLPEDPIVELPEYLRTQEQPELAPDCVLAPTLVPELTESEFETIIKGFEGLEVHNDVENCSEEITLFPLLSAIFKCNMSEKLTLWALDFISSKAKLTNKAGINWYLRVEQARKNVDKCTGIGALYKYLETFNPEYYNTHLRACASASSGIDLKDSFTFGDIRRNGPKGYYQFAGDPNKLDYNKVLNDLRRCLLIIEGGDCMYGIKELDALSERTQMKFYTQKQAKSMLKDVKVGTELKEGKNPKLIYKSALDVLEAGFNNEMFHKDAVAFYSEHESIFSYFQGYKYEPVQNDALIEKFLHHIKHVWCKDNLELFTYVQSWFATIIQHPLGRCKTALVVKGAQGTGKNIVTDCWCELLSGYSNPSVTKIDHIIGKFNTAVENKKLLVANEMTSADFRTKTDIEDSLKALITENTINIEDKGIKVREGVQNVSNLIILSNNFNPVRVENDDRRYCILTPSEEFKGNEDYFDELCDTMKTPQDQYKKDFMQALMYYYMNYGPIVRLRKIPETIEKVIAQQSNKSSIECFVEEYCVQLSADGLSPKDCYSLYVSYSQANGFRSFSSKSLKAELSRYCAMDSDGQLHRYKKQRVYRFTDEMMKQYSKLVEEKLAEQIDDED